jgi:hypothetical protein
MNKDFEEFWKEQEHGAQVLVPTTEELNMTSHKYQIDDAIAKYRLLSNLVQLYYFAKHGSKMVGNRFDYDAAVQESNVTFQLKPKDKEK